MKDISEYCIGQIVYNRSSVSTSFSGLKESKGDEYVITDMTRNSIEVKNIKGWGYKQFYTIGDFNKKFIVH